MDYLKHPAVFYNKTDFADFILRLLEGGEYSIKIEHE